MKTNTCCFIGHRQVSDAEMIKTDIFALVEKLISEKNVNTFLFGSKSQFNSLCLKVVTKLKEKYPHIKRVYVRAEYQYIDENYKKYLLQHYEDTYYPEKVGKAGRLAYVVRNYEMIDKSDFCIMYYHKDIATTPYKSGTKIAFDYAKKLSKKTINMSTLRIA